MMLGDTESKTSAQLPIVILISGRGSNMLAIAERAARGELPISVRAVISDKPDAAGLASAEQLDIPVVSLSPRSFANRESYDIALSELVASFRPQLIVLAGFMRILTANFIDRFAGRILNIHPSLLPKYRGLHTHRRAIAAGDSVHGASVHYVTQELDGGPVIMQASVPVQADDTEESLSARVQRLEHRIYPQVIEWIAHGRIGLRSDGLWFDGKPLPAPVMLESGD
jgi:phosphoribosylglycinamide formyltransferase-1